MSLNKTILRAVAIGTCVAAMAAPQTILAEGNPYGGGWGNCTWSAWELAYEAGYILPALGNAGSWYSNAAADGLSVGTYPSANSIAVYSNHVVYVSAFDGTNIYLKEGGYNGGYNEGWADGFSARHGQALIGYIYLDGYAYSGEDYTIDNSSAARSTTGTTTTTTEKKKEETVKVSAEAAEALKNEASSVVFDNEVQENLKVDEVDAAKQYKLDVLTGKVVKVTDQ